MIDPAVWQRFGRLHCGGVASGKPNLQELHQPFVVHRRAADVILVQPLRHGGVEVRLTIAGGNVEDADVQGRDGGVAQTLASGPLYLCLILRPWRVDDDQAGAVEGAPHACLTCTVHMRPG